MRGIKHTYLSALHLNNAFFLQTSETAAHCFDHQAQMIGNVFATHG